MKTPPQHLFISAGRISVRLLAASASFAVALAASAVAAESRPGKVVVNASEFGLREEHDATLPLRRAIEACRAQAAKRLVIPPGRYHLSPGYAAEYYGAPSNGDQGLKRVALLIDGFDGLEIEGTGAELLFRNQMVPVIVANSRHITLRGFTIDWEKLLAFEATVVSTDAGTNSFVLEPHPDCVTAIVGGVLLHGENPEESTHYWPLMQDLTWTRWFDPASECWLRDGPYVDNHSYRDRIPERGLCARVEQAGPGRYRLIDAASVLPQAGWVMACKGMRTPNRRSPAIWVTGSADTRVEDVRIHHAGGMGIIAERSRNVHLLRVQVTPRPGSGRTVSTSADATHFTACAGLIEFADCLFTGMLDDATNVHGAFRVVELLPDRRRVVARAGHFQQVGHRFADAGDRIRFCTSGGLEARHTATVAAVDELNGHRAVLTFAQDIPPDVLDGFVMENLSWTPDVHIHGCTVRSNLARSILVKTAGRVVIEDNRFYRPAENAIGGGPGAGFWFESGELHDVTIRRNEIEVIAEGSPCLSFSGPSAGYHSNLLVEENTFISHGGPILRLRGFEHVRFRHNRIISRSKRPLEPGFVLQLCNDVRIEENEVLSGHEYTIESTDSAEITCERNKGIAQP